MQKTSQHSCQNTVWVQSTNNFSRASSHKHCLGLKGLGRKLSLEIVQNFRFPNEASPSSIFVFLGKLRGNFLSSKCSRAHTFLTKTTQISEILHTKKQHEYCMGLRTPFDIRGPPLDCWSEHSPPRTAWSRTGYFLREPHYPIDTACPATKLYQ